MQNEPNPFLCQPAVLGSRKLATCFLSQLFYSQFDSSKYEDSIVFNSVSRYDDVYMMTQFIDRNAVGIRCNRTALWYKRLPSATSRAVDSHPGKQSSNPSQAFFFVMSPLYVSITPLIY